ncbi:hypothetical protein [Thermofilum pendens]|uniref:Uncharacterized protein n=1 Tax=Thermofilum pendens (strain DSM 2475 / Hrk 5) TaxID=368408 RepID=A1S1C9_THEPD|nr:hypothetical protein [Thermofilum pendens]ABL79259.1 hypothetical protein Tpen_1864 [Thermofilum pendens Hrk 5]
MRAKDFLVEEVREWLAEYLARHQGGIATVLARYAARDLRRYHPVAVSLAITQVKMVTDKLGRVWVLDDKLTRYAKVRKYVYRRENGGVGEVVREYYAN